MGHYESSGYIWDKGEVPQCEYCGELATHSTHTCGIHICDKDECRIRYCDEQFMCDEIRWVEDDDDEEEEEEEEDFEEEEDDDRLVGRWDDRLDR